VHPVGKVSVFLVIAHVGERQHGDGFVCDDRCGCCGSRGFCHRRRRRLRPEDHGQGHPDHPTAPASQPVRISRRYGWGRGPRRSCGGEQVNRERFGDILEGLRTERLGLQRQLPFTASYTDWLDADRDRPGLRLQAGGDVHPVADHIPACAEDITQVDADAVLQRVGRPGAKLLLDLQRASHRLDHAPKAAATGRPRWT